MNGHRRLGLGIGPAGIFYVLFFIFPALSFFRSSTTSDDGIFGNYVTVLTSGTVQKALVTTLQLSLITAVISLALGYALAYQSVRGPAWLSRVIGLAAFTALFTSVITRALGWRVLLGDSGPISQLLQLLHVVDHPVRIINTFAAVVIGMVQVELPITMLALIPVIQALPQDLERAAHGLGESRWRAFFTVHLPLTWTRAIPIGLIAMMSTASFFSTPVLLGGGRVVVLSMMIQEAAQVAFDYPTAATLAVLLTVVVLVIAILVLMFAKRGRVAKARVVS